MVTVSAAGVQEQRLWRPFDHCSFSGGGSRHAFPSWSTQHAGRSAGSIGRQAPSNTLLCSHFPLCSEAGFSACVGGGIISVRAFHPHGAGHWLCGCCSLKHCVCWNSTSQCWALALWLFSGALCLPELPWQAPVEWSVLLLIVSCLLPLLCGSGCTGKSSPKSGHKPALLHVGSRAHPLAA